jgi:molybdopterin-guanine dinucleotide biosynthesis protein A
VGFALAGGLSRRMGRDKAQLPWGDSTLLDHALDRLRAVAGEVAILAGAEPRYADRGVRVHLDTVAGAGPIGGLLAALEALGGHGQALLLAVDLPLVPEEVLRLLVRRARGADAAVPVTSRGPEPLCAVYGAACLGAVGAAVGDGRLAMTAFWTETRIRKVDEAELRRLGDPTRMFTNVNGPEDYAALAGVAGFRAP